MGEIVWLSCLLGELFGNFKPSLVFQSAKKTFKHARCSNLKKKHAKDDISLENGNPTNVKVSSWLYTSYKECESDQISVTCRK